MMIMIQISKKISGKDLNLCLTLYQVLVIVKILVAQIVVHLKENEKIVVSVFIHAESALLKLANVYVNVLEGLVKLFAIHAKHVRNVLIALVMLFVDV